MMVAVVDYEAGNLRSVETALRHIGVQFVVSQDPDVVVKADRLVFPGVGDAGAAMRVLRRTGLDAAISEFFRSGRPMLGICVGCQVILDGSEETDEPCLGLVPGVARLFPGGRGLKVPQIGWNNVSPRGDDPLFRGIPSGTSFYFVHSYYPDPVDKDAVLCTTDYGLEFASGIRKDNLAAVQFHPEKSGEYGLQMLRNFLSDSRT